MLIGHFESFNVWIVLKKQTVEKLQKIAAKSFETDLLSINFILNP
jgi:hypothetical protein